MPETPSTPVTPQPASSDPSADADGRELAQFLKDQDARQVAAARWFVRWQDGLSADEEAEFQRWLRADAAHARAFDRFRDLWAQASSAWPTLGLNRRAWLARVGRLAPQAEAAGIAPGLVGGGWWGWQRLQGAPLCARTLATPRGRQASLELPDGSQLQLDTASRLDIVFSRDRCEVYLSGGQGLFAVQPDATRPFHVNAGALRITVIGTRFAVRHLNDGAGVLTSVQHGHVRVVRATVLLSRPMRSRRRSS